MTEAEWFGCDDPRPLLELMRGRVSDRKLVLFIRACCRRRWGPAADDATRAALALLDHFTEAGPAQRAATHVYTPAGGVVLDCGASEPVARLEVPAQIDPPRWVDPHAALPRGLGVALEQLACARFNPLIPRFLADSADRLGLPLADQGALLRDVVRGPFEPLTFRAAWRLHDGGAAVKLAELIYQDEAFDDLPVLADLLEDAGCRNLEILGHLRGPGPHVRGCWVVDLLLSKDR
jgi:hypothetical protein